MIERYVFLKLTDEHANPEGRTQVVVETQKLRKLAQVRGLTVGTPADDRSAGDWDISIVVRFDRIEDVEAYRVHPEHRAYVDDFLRPRMASIKAWNFETSE